MTNKRTTFKKLRRFLRLTPKTRTPSNRKKTPSPRHKSLSKKKYKSKSKSKSPKLRPRALRNTQKISLSPEFDNRGARGYKPRGPFDSNSY
jgi:hypothetical protein